LNRSTSRLRRVAEARHINSYRPNIDTIAIAIVKRTAAAALKTLGGENERGERNRRNDRLSGV